MITNLGSLIQCVVGKEGQCKLISLACVESACSIWATLGLSEHKLACASWVYTAQALSCSARVLSQVSPAFHALPRSKQLSFLGTLQGHRPGWAVHFLPFPGLRSSGNQVLASTLSRLCSESYHLSGPTHSVYWMRHQSAVSGVSMCLLWGADLRLQPSWQMSTVQYPRKTWLANGSLFPVWWRMPSLGLKLPLAFQLWLSPACLSASCGGEEPVSSLELSFGICSILCSVSGPGCGLG